MISIALKGRWEVPDEARVATIELLTRNVSDESLPMRYRIQSGELLSKILNQQDHLDIAIENLKLKIEAHGVLKQYADSTASFSSFAFTDADCVSDEPQASLDG